MTTLRSYTATGLLAIAGVAITILLAMGMYRAGRADAPAPRLSPASSPYRPLYLEGSPGSGSAVTSVVTTEDATILPGTPIVVLPDPVLQLPEHVSLFEKWWRGGQIQQAIFLALFVIGTIASRKVAWLRVGHRAVWASAIVSGLGMVVEAAMRGTTPNLAMLSAVAMTVLAKVMNPNAPEQMAAGVPMGRALKTPPVVPTQETDAEIDARAATLYADYASAATGDKAAWSSLELSERARWRAVAKAVPKA